MSKRDPNPNWNQRDAPHTARQTPQGREVIWFKPSTATPPKAYDYSVSHTSKKGWRVYFLLLCALAVPLCCIVRLVMEVL